MTIDMPWYEVQLPDMPWLLLGLAVLSLLVVLAIAGNRPDTALEKDDEA